MNLELTDQEHAYFLQVLVQRPLAEALPLYLKVTSQKITPAQEPAQGNLPLKAVEGR